MKKFLIWWLIIKVCCVSCCMGYAFNVSQLQVISDTNQGFIATITYQGKRYRLSSVKRSFANATKFCGEHFSRAVEINSQEEQQLIWNIMNSMKPLSSYYGDVWTGLQLEHLRRGLGLTGFWNGDKKWNSSVNYSGFSGGQPDGKIELCIQLWKKQNFTWDNAKCTRHKLFICENTVPNENDIKSISQSMIKSFSNEDSIAKRQLQHLASQMDYLLESSPSDLMKSDKELLNQSLFVVESSLRRYNFKEGNLNLSLPNIKMEAIKVSNQSLDLMDLRFGDVKRPNKSSSTALFSWKLLQELFNHQQEDIQLTSVVYRHPDIFKGAEDVSNYVDEQSYPSHILTNVLSVSVGGMHVSHLSTPLQIISFIPQYTTNKSFSEVDQRFSKVPSSVRQNPGKYFNGDMRYTVEEKCAFWDFSKSSWSYEGCRMESEVQNGDSKEIKCSCDHMTHFAVILDLEETYMPKYLSTVTLIGCCASTVCLFATIFINLSLRQLRTKLSQKILINICISLLLINIIFVIGIDNTEEYVRCFVTTILLHYSVLLLWAWLFVEGTFLFRYLIYGRFYQSQLNSGRFFVISSILSYTIPAVIVASTASLLERNAYQSEKYCWLARDPMLFSILVPIGVVIFSNLCIFAGSMYLITCGKKNLKKESSMRKFTTAFRRAVSMVFSLGLPWIFGYFMLLSSNQTTKEIFSLLFSVLNSLQGTFIFYLYCFRQGNVRKLVVEKLSKSIPQTSGSSLLHRVHKVLDMKRTEDRDTIKSQKTLDTRLDNASTTATANYKTVDFKVEQKEE